MNDTAASTTTKSTLKTCDAVRSTKSRKRQQVTCRCGRPVSKDGKTFPHRETISCKIYKDTHPTEWWQVEGVSESWQDRVAREVGVNRFGEI